MNAAASVAAPSSRGSTAVRIVLVIASMATWFSPTSCRRSELEPISCVAVTSPPATTATTVLVSVIVTISSTRVIPRSLSRRAARGAAGPRWCVMAAVTSMSGSVTTVCGSGVFPAASTTTRVPVSSGHAADAIHGDAGHAGRLGLHEPGAGRQGRR